MDISYLLFLQKWRESTNGMFDTFFSQVTHLGEYEILIFVLAALYWGISKKIGSFVIVSFYMHSIFVSLFKNMFAVYRPWIRSSAIHPVPSAFKTATGYSFPSGHSSASFIYYVAPALMLKKKWLIAIAVFIALLVGFSRNYLGVHTPQDVVGGFVLSIATLFITCKIFKALEKDPNKDVKIALYAMLAYLLVALYCYFKPYPLDYDSMGNVIVDPKKMALDTWKYLGGFYGCMLGWILERHFVKFDDSGKIWQRAVRIIVCLICYVLFNKYVVSNVYGGFGGHIICKSMAYFLGTFYVLFIAPVIIKLLEKKGV
ncbi:MAG: phosphatase PAP2 family protein [Alphaproteobacteria bacterium]|nr:phosphatase PAP2 family protein [Alphaproteobacteria bacterium]